MYVCLFIEWTKLEIYLFISKYDIVYSTRVTYVIVIITPINEIRPIITHLESIDIFLFVFSCSTSLFISLLHTLNI